MIFITKELGFDHDIQPVREINNNKSAIFIELASYLPNHYNTINQNRDWIQIMRNRMKKPILICLAKLCDQFSLFSQLPMELLYLIIFFTYWNDTNSIVDISDDDTLSDTPVIYYTQFRNQQK